MVFGLPNSGKTSIILALKGEKNLMTYFSLKPTLGIDIQKYIEETEDFYIWDFGGQERFRENYLKELPKHLDGADQIIYVIDVQKTDEYELACDYLNQILEIEDAKTVELIIYLHKYDPFLELEPNHKVNQKIAEYLPKIKNMLEKEEISFKIFKTSIFTQFRKLPV